MFLIIIVMVVACFSSLLVIDVVAFCNLILDVFILSTVCCESSVLAAITIVLTAIGAVYIINNNS